MHLKISIIIPFYKNKKWLEEALDSVYNQTYKNIEIIIVNDGSKENILDIEKKYHKNITFLKQKNMGAAFARNEGIGIATGEYIAFLDSDDIWYPKKLSKQVHYMKENNLDWSHTDYARFKDNPENIEDVKCNLSGMIVPKCFIWNPIATPCVMIKNSILNNNNDLRFDNNKAVGEDGYLWQMIGKEYELGYLPEVLTKVRIHGNNAALSAAVQLKYRGDSIENIKKNKFFFKSNFIYFYFLSLLEYCALSYRIIYYFIKLFKINDSTFEIICKFAYIIPYANFKIIKRFI